MAVVEVMLLVRSEVHVLLLVMLSRREGRRWQTMHRYRGRRWWHVRLLRPVHWYWRRWHGWDSSVRCRGVCCWAAVRHGRHRVHAGWGSVLMVLRRLCMQMSAQLQPIRDLKGAPEVRSHSQHIEPVPVAVAAETRRHTAGGKASAEAAPSRR